MSDAVKGGRTAGLELELRPSDRWAVADRGRHVTKDDVAERRTYRVQALSKGLRVLTLFDGRRASLRLSDIAAEAGLLMPTAYRIVMTLVEEGYLEQLPDGQYRPGLQVLRLGHASLKGLDLVEAASSRLERLARGTGETVNMAQLVGDQILYLLRFRNRDLVTANLQVGSTLPAAYASMGKVLLAALPSEDLRARINEASFSAARGPAAVRTLKELERQLETVRSSGYATQNEEVAFGLRSVAVALNTAPGVAPTAINVAVNTLEWPIERLVDELLPSLQAAAAEISEIARG
jgi:IclR family transcriptional regulator, pca regulon regulatory protein